MSLTLLKPSYSKEPIRSVRSLCAMLRLGESELRALAADASSLYRTVKPKPGSKRETFDALPRLKAVHRRIKTQILERVVFPEYLTGSLKGRDYKANAAIHAGQRVLVCEDVKGFFPSVSAAQVNDVWVGFFGFSGEVGQLLTQLTTKDGALPQGAIPSSFIANLVLWRVEPLVQAKLAAKNITYSRYVDDISMSSPNYLSRAAKTGAIGMVYGMLRSAGLTAGRAKHEIFDGSTPMIVTKLVVNGARPALSKEKRSAVRAAVFQLQQEVSSDQGSADALAAINKLAQRVGQLGRFHPRLGTRYKAQLQAAREVVTLGAGPATAEAKGHGSDQVGAEPSGAVPWD